MFRNILKRKQIKQNIIMAVLTAAIWVLGGIYLNMIKEENAMAVQQSLASQVVRFHVLAASDSGDDQALKLLVKNSVLEYMSEPLSRCENAQEALSVLDSHTNEILKVARQVIRDNGYNYQVTASIEDVYFPVKTYGDVTFPAGVYTAYRIIIGQGEGSNWWCVLYPPLCFIDITHGILPDESKEQLKAVLTDDEYDFLLSRKIEPEDISFRFRILTFLNPD